MPETVLLIAFVVFVLAGHTEEEQFLRLLRQARPGWLAVALLLQLATYPCDAALWQRVLARAGARTSMAGLARLSLMKLTFDQVIPTAGIGGSVLVARGLRKEGASPEAATAAVLLTVLCSYTAQALSVVASLVFLWSRQELNAWVRWTATVFAVVSVAIPAVILTLANGQRRPLWRWVQRVRGLPALLRAISDVPPRLLRSPRLLAEGSLLQVVIFALDGGTLGTLILALGVSAPFSTVFVSFVIASAAQTISVLPGGVGTFEAASVAMLAFLGVSLRVALIATLLLRGFTLWIPLLPGFYLLHWSLRWKGRTTPDAG